MGYNRTILEGYLTADPRTNTTRSGTFVCNFRIGVTERYTDSQGKKGENTIFLDVSVWAGRGEACAKYLSKGSRVLVEGRLTEDKYTKDDGTEVRAVEVVASRVEFLDKASDNRDR